MKVSSTPHIGITDTDDVAKTVLMPGDPLRAKFIAENFLTDVKQINSIRNMYAYTGLYKGKPITVFGSGMGMASIGIYSYELFNIFGVENIVRIGSAGSYSKRLDVYDTVLVKDAVSESTFARAAYGYLDHILPSSEELNEKLREAAKKLGIELKEANAHSSDVFYHDENTFNWQAFSKANDVECVEMEAFSLFANARFSGKKAACLLSISDSFVSHIATTPEERQQKFTNMIEIALQLALDE